MRTKLIESDKPEKYIHSVRNADTSASGQTISAGTPLILNLSQTPQPSVYSNGLPPGYQDGLQVILPSSANANQNSLFQYGVAIAPITYGNLGESLVHGVAQVSYVRGTRSASSANWPAGASQSGFGAVLLVDTVNNAFSTGTVSAGVYSTFIMLDNPISYGSSASAPGDTRTAFTTLQRAFVKIM